MEFLTEYFFQTFLFLLVLFIELTKFILRIIFRTYPDIIVDSVSLISILKNIFLRKKKNIKDKIDIIENKVNKASDYIDKKIDFIFSKSINIIEGYLITSIFIGYFLILSKYLITNDYNSSIIINILSLLLAYPKRNFFNKNV